MLTRRSLALATMFCLLIGLLAVPRGPLLVCRISGTPMAPVVVSLPDMEGSCCDIAVASSTEGAINYALTAPGCCELTQDSSPQQAPANIVGTPEASVTVIPGEPVGAPAPSLTPVVLSLVFRTQSDPRAPPLTAASPRAPPIFS